MTSDANSRGAWRLILFGNSLVPFWPVCLSVCLLPVCLSGCLSDYLAVCYMLGSPSYRRIRKKHELSTCKYLH